MDFARTLLASFILIYSAYATAGIEYISPEQREKLITQFNEAAFTKADAKKLEDSKWTCDMYGVRSNMQVQRELKLYRMAQKDGEWQNRGAQVVATYKADGNTLTGVKDRFEDQVKITKDGLLVSRLSLNDQSKTVIAYSVCKTL